MKTFKRSFGLFLVLALVSTACGGSDDDGASSSASSSAAVATTAAPAATTAAPSVVETPEEEAVGLPDLGGRTVSVAIENAYLPYNYVDAETGDIGGFDYDFFGEICNRLNCE
ncbi:MAG: hypothetical protein P8L35_07415, partial [Acidimicrobiales bacterium]|nr:hypothetical protein [Acidimicrobiales bacterium]